MAKGTLLTRPGWFPGKKLKCPFSNKINELTHPRWQNFLRVVSDWVRLCWMDSHHGLVTHCVTQDFNFTQGMLSWRKKSESFPFGPQGLWKIMRWKVTFLWPQLVMTCEHVSFAQLGFSWNLLLWIKLGPLSTYPTSYPLSYPSSRHPLPSLTPHSHFL